MQATSYSNKIALSQSSIKDWRFKYPLRWRKLWLDKTQDDDRKSDSFDLGSLVDTLLLTPELIDERFIISDEKLPSKAIESIIKSAYLEIVNVREQEERIKNELPNYRSKNFVLDEYKDILDDCACNYVNDKKEVGWNKTWKKETRIKKLIEEGTNYLSLLVRANGRKIIDPSINMDAIAMVKVLQTDDNVKSYFVQQEGELLFHQHEIFANYILSTGFNVPLKGALDIVRINHNEKTIQIVDFKTSYNAFDFITEIKKYSYCTQLSFYDYLLREWLENNCKDEKFCKYTILPPANIVIDSNELVAYIYEYDWKDIAIEADGNSEFLYSLHSTTEHNDKIKKGWKNIVETIGWHMENNYWDKTKELYENKKIKVNLINL